MLQNLFGVNIVENGGGLTCFVIVCKHTPFFWRVLLVFKNALGIMWVIKLGGKRFMEKRVLELDNVFTKEKLMATIKVFCNSLTKLAKLQDKLNEGCKCILTGNPIPKSMLTINAHMDELMGIINNCLVYIKAYDNNTFFIA